IENVRTLLGHAKPAFDPLEQELDEALADMPRADLDEELHEPPEDDDSVAVDCDLFLSKLSDVGVLSPDEFASVSESMISDPQQLASQLVTSGKLTEYQASALLRGEPELLIDKYLILDL